MLGIVDRATCEIRVFFVNNNRQRETLLPIIKNIYILAMNIFMIIKIVMIYLYQLEFIVIVGNAIR